MGKAEKTMEERGQKAAVRFLEQLGYTIVEAKEKKAASIIPIVAWDADVLVFVSVPVIYGRMEDLPPSDAMQNDRAVFETYAESYLGKHPELSRNGEVRIRFDEVALLVMCEDRALLRHHVNTISDRDEQTRESPITSGASKPSLTEEVLEDTDATLWEKGLLCAVAFLTHQGYEVLDAESAKTHRSAPLVAKDDDSIVFVRISVREHDADGEQGSIPSASTRAKRERDAAAWLVKNREQTESDCVAVRFDDVSMIVISESRALVRHHINVFGSN